MFGVALPFVLSGITILVMVMAGNKNKNAWLVGLVNQSLWLVFIVMTESWGLLVLMAALVVVYSKNYRKWSAEE